MEWQEMTSAPRDGRTVLVRVPVSEQLGTGERIAADVALIARFDGRNWLLEPSGLRVRPTGWMPEPRPPPP